MRDLFFVMIFLAFCGFSLQAKPVANGLASESSYSEKMDSVVSYYDNNRVGKDVYKYDERGNQIELTEYYRYSEGLREDEQTIYEYNDNNDIITKIENTWDYNTSSWIEYRMYEYEYEYDANNNLIQQINTTNYIEENLILVSKDEYSYNEDNLLTLEVYSNLKDSTFVLQHKTEYIYEGSNIIEEIYSNYRNDMWEITSKYIYEYDENDNMLSRTYFDYVDSEYIPLSRNLYSYDNNNNMIERVSGSIENDTLVYSWKNVYEYDQNNKLIDEMEMSWDEDIETWINDYRTEYQRDEFGNILEISNYHGDEEDLSNWIPYFKLIYEIDYSRIFSEIMIPDEAETNEMFVNAVISMSSQEWDEEIGDWVGNEKALVFYSPVTTSVNNSEKIEVRLYPNPANEYIIADTDMISSGILSANIINLSGRIIKSMNITVMSGRKIDISDLPAGKYFLKINADKPYFVPFVKE